MASLIEWGECNLDPIRSRLFDVAVRVASILILTDLSRIESCGQHGTFIIAPESRR